MNEETLNVTTELTVNESIKADLLSAAKWAKFLCIVGCVGSGLMVIVGVVLIGLGSMLPRMPFGAAMGFLYLILVGIYIYPLMKGFQFANGTKAACLSNDEQELARGISGLNSQLKYMGILTIILLSIYALLLLVMIVAIAIGH